MSAGEHEGLGDAAWITDTHGHLYWESLSGELDAVLSRARAAGVQRVVVPGTDVASSRAALSLCAGRAGLFATAGLHPHDAAALDESALAQLRELCALPECVGVGESGLDYFKEFSPRAAQRTAFAAQLELARELQKPIVVHCRDAHADTVALLREHADARGRVRGVMHCYSFGPDELAPYLELGLHISFSGMLTYPRNEANREAARQAPRERVLVETDCPFLAPQAVRGKRNEPAHARLVLEELARVRGEALSELARATSANAAVLFGLGRERKSELGAATPA